MQTRQRNSKAPPLLAVILFAVALGGCSQPSPANSPQAQPPAGQRTNAAAPDSPSQDTAQTGRLLLVRSGQLVQLERGSLKVLAGGERYQSPAFASGGARIAASIVGDNHSDLVLLDGAGRRLQQLTDNWSKSRLQDSAWARHPTWSPDGRGIAFVGDSAGNQMSLWVLDVASGKQRQLLPSPGLSGLDWPSWSPNGQEITVTEFDSKSSQIVSVNASTGGTKTLTNQSEGAYDPAWSPDGTRIAFAARTNGRSDIWIMDKTGDSAQRLTDVGMARAPAWSPSGDLLAFLADRGNDFDLFIVKPAFPLQQPVATSQLQRLTDGQHLEAPSGISWSR